MGRAEAEQCLGVEGRATTQGVEGTTPWVPLHPLGCLQGRGLPQ